VLAHQLGQHLVLLLQLGFQSFDLARLGGLLTGIGGLGLEDGGPVLEELLLPEVKKGGLDLVLLTDVGDGYLLDQVLTQHGQLLGPGEMASVV
jgi:hypothetical protein